MCGPGGVQKHNKANLVFTSFTRSKRKKGLRTSLRWELKRKEKTPRKQGGRGGPGHTLKTSRHLFVIEPFRTSIKNEWKSVIKTKGERNWKRRKIRYPPLGVKGAHGLSAGPRKEKTHET